MDAAEHDEAPASAVRVGDGVRARRGLRVDADPHQIGRVALAREIDRVEPVVAEGQLDVVRRVRRERRDPERLDVRRVLVRRGDEVDVKRRRHAPNYTRFDEECSPTKGKRRAPKTASLARAVTGR